LAPPYYSQRTVFASPLSAFLKVLSKFHVTAVIGIINNETVSQTGFNDHDRNVTKVHDNRIITCTFHTLLVLISMHHHFLSSAF